jgi:3-hydroxyisobutyrate dehydrogenase-like beta-hydroxyacid dehydrogenase
MDALHAMEIGFIGLGNMGSGMAANLLAAGHSVTVYNRSPGKMEALVRRGAIAADTVAEACGGQVVFTMLADDSAVENVTFGDPHGRPGILASLAKGATHVSSSSISVAMSQRLAQAHAEAGQQFVAAPVFGRPEAASAAKLFVITAGHTQALTPLAPLFEAIGQRTFVVSDQPHAANLVKLSGNFLIASAIESIGEAVALVTKGGVDRQQYVDILTSTLFAAPVYQTYGGLIARREFEPAGFAATLGLKDVQLALAAAHQLQVPLPVASLVRDRLLTLVATGGGQLDWSAVSALAERDSGALDHAP